MGKSNDLGTWGESQARCFLEGKGYSFVEGNFHSPYGEIDLIMSDKTYLLFVEVKLRKNAKYGTPAEAVTRSKQEKLRNTALIYLQTHETGLQPRFDVVEIYAPKGTDTNPIPVHHIENAF